MKENERNQSLCPAKKKHPVRLEELTPDEKVKYEIAEELGLLDRVMQDGMEITYIKRNRKNRRSDHEKEASDWNNEKNDKNITNVN